MRGRSEPPGPAGRLTLRGTNEIGELAGASGVSADTIRYYERIGLMPPARRTPSGYREYPSGARDRIRVIRNAVQLGFPLQEIARVLRIRDAGGAPCRQVRDYARELVGEIERRVAELQVERKAMQQMLEKWDAMLAAAPAGAAARLLERDDTIAARRPRARQSRLKRSRRGGPK